MLTEFDDPYADDGDLPDILAPEDTFPFELIAVDTVDADFDGHPDCDHDDDPDYWAGVLIEQAAVAEPAAEGLYGGIGGLSINGFVVGSLRTTGVRTFRVPGTQVSLPVRADIAPLLIGFAAEYHRLVEPLVRGWNWGYAYRAVRGASKPSFHAAGIAIDLNAPRHPLGRRGTFSRKQVATIKALCRKYGLRWGGTWRRADEMHFEVILTRTQALARVRQLQARPAVRPSAAQPTYPVLRRGAVGHSVRNVQDALRRCGNHHLKLTGRFDAETERLVRKFQSNRGLKADGVVGPATWTHLRKVPR